MPAITLNLAAKWWTTLSYLFSWCLYSRCVKAHGKLLTQDMLGVRPTELCTWGDNDLKENKFIKLIAELTQIVEGRIQVRMPWNGEETPMRAITMLHKKEWFILKSILGEKDCLKIVVSEVQKLLEPDYWKRKPWSAWMVSGFTSGFHTWPNNASSTSVRCLSEGLNGKVA